MELAVGVQDSAPSGWYRADATAALPIMLRRSGIVVTALVACACLAGACGEPDARTEQYCRDFCEDGFGNPDAASTVEELAYRGGAFAEDTFVYCTEAMHGQPPSADNRELFHEMRLNLVEALGEVDGSSAPPEPAKRAILNMSALARNVCAPD